MTITVNGPGGVTINFPDGTDTDTINAVMTQHTDKRAAFEMSGPDGATYEVHAPDEASALSAFGQFAGGAPQPDKYQQAALKDLAVTKAIPSAGASYQQQFIHGATLGADTALMAGLETPLEMIKRGTWSPLEGYKYAKAREDASLNDARANDGMIGTGMEIAGGVLGGGALAKGGISATRALSQTPGFIGKTLASAADAALQGGIQGFNEGDGVSDSLAKGASGALVGGALGGGLSAGGQIIGGIGKNIVGAIRGHVAPEAAARAQVARAIQEGGVTAPQIDNAVRQAAAEGQPQFNVADAMGNPGQRLLSTVARAPGEGRTAVVDAMEQRQAGQGRRVANALDEGFGTNGQTAAQTRDAMTAARDSDADDAYDAVRNGAGQVDVVPAINNIDRNIGTGPGQALRATNDSIEGALQPFRERLARVNPDDFEAVQRIRGDMADAAQNARQNGYGNRARLIGQAVRELDNSMEAASPGFRQANTNFRQASRNIDAIDQGRTAALRGRTEDTIPTFNALTDEGQQAFRSGYVDPLIEQAQGGAYGVNKARPLGSDAFQQESAAMAPGNDLMQRKLGRENTMFQTRNTALGGSKTADNLADADSMGVDPVAATVAIGHAVSGNAHGLLSALKHSGVGRLFTGNTPTVRAEVAKYLLRNGANLAPGQLQAAIDSTIQKMQRTKQVADLLGSVTRSAVTTAQNQIRNQR